MVWIVSIIVRDVEYAKSPPGICTVFLAGDWNFAAAGEVGRSLVSPCPHNSHAGDVTNDRAAHANMWRKTHA